MIQNVLRFSPIVYASLWLNKRRGRPLARTASHRLQLARTANARLAQGKVLREYRLVVGGVERNDEGRLCALLVGSPDGDRLHYEGRVDFGLHRVRAAWLDGRGRIRIAIPRRPQRARPTSGSQRGDYSARVAEGRRRAVATRCPGGCELNAIRGDEQGSRRRCLYFFRCD